MDPKPEGAVLSLFDNTASREVLGIEYRELNQSIVEMADAMVATGAAVKPAAQ